MLPLLAFLFVLLLVLVLVFIARVSALSQSVRDLKRELDHLRVEGVPSHLTDTFFPDAAHSEQKPASIAQQITHEMLQIERTVKTERTAIPSPPAPVTGEQRPVKTKSRAE